MYPRGDYPAWYHENLVSYSDLAIRILQLRRDYGSYEYDYGPHEYHKVPIIVSIDTERYRGEEGVGRPSEVGIAVLDLLDLKYRENWGEPSGWSDFRAVINQLPQYLHLVAEDTNRQVPMAIMQRPDYYSYNEFKPRVMQFLEHVRTRYSTGDRPRPMVLVGWSVDVDIHRLLHIFGEEELDELFRWVADVAIYYQQFLRLSRTAKLMDALDSLGLDRFNMHNALHDAVYALRVLTRFLYCHPEPMRPMIPE